jgi:CelD/BcsL family acetyltransferase involved in cellulose biosynthesis
MRIEYHFESGGFGALKPEWNDLLHRSCCDNLFLTWEWLSTWWKHLGEGELQLLGFRAEADGRLVGIAPLFHTQTDDGKSVVYLVGCRDISDYLDLIVERGQEDAVYQAVLDYLASEAPAWDLVDFCNIPQDSLTFVRLRELAEARGYQTLVEVEDVCPIITLPATWDEYLMTLDKKQRHEVRRKLRRAEGGADTRFTIVGPDHDLEAEMTAFIDLHQKSIWRRHPRLQFRLRSGPIPASEPRDHRHSSLHRACHNAGPGEVRFSPRRRGLQVPVWCSRHRGPASADRQARRTDRSHLLVSRKVPPSHRG